jgi:hypothetical protein
LSDLKMRRYRHLVEHSRRLCPHRTFASMDVLRCTETLPVRACKQTTAAAKPCRKRAEADHTRLMPGAHDSGTKQTSKTTLILPEGTRTTFCTVTRTSIELAATQMGSERSPAQSLGYACRCNDISVGLFLWAQPLGEPVWRSTNAPARKVKIRNLRTVLQGRRGAPEMDSTTLEDSWRRYRSA